MYAEVAGHAFQESSSQGEKQGHRMEPFANANLSLPLPGIWTGVRADTAVLNCGIPSGREAEQKESQTHHRPPAPIKLQYLIQVF